MIVIKIKILTKAEMLDKNFPFIEPGKVHAIFMQIFNLKWSSWHLDHYWKKIYWKNVNYININILIYQYFIFYKDLHKY